MPNNERKQGRCRNIHPPKNKAYLSLLCPIEDSAQDALFVGKHRKAGFAFPAGHLYNRKGRKKGGTHEDSYMPYMRDGIPNQKAQQEILQFCLQGSGGKATADKVGSKKCGLHGGIHESI